MIRLGLIGVGFIGIGLGLPLWALADYSGYIRGTEAIDGKLLLILAPSIAALGLWVFWHRQPVTYRKRARL